MVTARTSGGTGKERMTVYPAVPDLSILPPPGDLSLTLGMADTVSVCQGNIQLWK